MSEQDSHISTGAKAEQPPGPTTQRHRNAMGEKVDGQHNPNGSAPVTGSKIAGQSKQY